MEVRMNLKKDSNPATAGASAGGFAAMDRNNDGYIRKKQ
jgi:hypothetical protein